MQVKRECETGCDTPGTAAAPATVTGEVHRSHWSNPGRQEDRRHHVEIRKPGIVLRGAGPELTPPPVGGALDRIRSLSTRVRIVLLVLAVLLVTAVNALFLLRTDAAAVPLARMVATVAALVLRFEWGMTYSELIAYATPGFIASLSPLIGGIFK